MHLLVIDALEGIDKQAKNERRWFFFNRKTIQQLHDISSFCSLGERITDSEVLVNGICLSDDPECLSSGKDKFRVHKRFQIGRLA